MLRSTNSLLIFENTTYGCDVISSTTIYTLFLVPFVSLAES